MAQLKYYEPPHVKTNKMACVPSEDRSAWAFAQSDQSLLCAQWVVRDPNFLHADSEDSDQTGWMSRLIIVFTGRTSFCWFCREVAHLSFLSDPGHKSSQGKGTSGDL